MQLTGVNEFMSLSAIFTSGSGFSSVIADIVISEIQPALAPRMTFSSETISVYSIFALSTPSAFTISVPLLPPHFADIIAWHLPL